MPEDSGREEACPSQIRARAWGGLLAVFIHNPHTSLDLVLPVNIAPGCSAGKARGDSRLFGDILVPVA